MEDNFVRADSRNLPKVDNVMIMEYIASSNQHSLAEIRGAKILLSSRDSYINTAVGYVEVRRTASNCIVKAKVMPEHRISKKLYCVTCVIDEQNDVIVNSECKDCAASAGGCKHSLLLLFWLATKSSEPSSTAVQCYWNKPKLSEATTQPVSSKEIFPKATVCELRPKDNGVLNEFYEECQRRELSNSLISKFCEVAKSDSLNIFDVLLSFLEHEAICHDYSTFSQYLKKIITEDVIKDINARTIGQTDNKYWHSMRQGRLTASKLHEAAHCKTDGALVEQLLGGYKVPETKAILRGKKLESRVLQTIKDKLGINFKKCGFMLINGILGASPDGVGEDFVVEVKCPASEKAVQSYIKDNTIKEKYKTQIMCQMLACNKPKGLFCVADPLFESTKNIHVVWVHFDENYINNVIIKTELFWQSLIYPKLLKSAKD